MAVGIMFLELFLILAGRYGLAIVFGVAGAVAEALANSNLGSVFASLNSRPFWYGAQLPVFFLACAVLSGAAAVVLFTYFSHSLQQRKMTEGTEQGIQTAGKIMVLMIFFVSLATAWKFVNAYLGTQELVLAVDSMVKGPLAISFWGFEIGLGLVLPFILLVVSRLLSVSVMAVAALMILVGQFFSRFNMVVAGQIVPNNHGFVGVPNYFSYSPTLLEYLLVVAGLGVVLLGFVVGERFFDKTFNLESSH
jgi:molybdopterin-containing oxidoreductase family membrane subunit